MKNEIKSRIMAMLGSVNFLFLKMERSERGSLCLLSFTRNTPNEAMNRSSTATVTGPIPCAPARSPMKRMMATMNRIMENAPTQSISRRSFFVSPRFRYFSARGKITAPIGTLIRKIYSHPTASVRKPPRTGAARLAMAIVAPTYPIALPCSPVGNISKSIAAVIEKIMAPPVAWRTLNSTSSVRLVERPHASELSVKSAIPARKSFLFPVYSDIFPNIRRREVSVTRYPVITHWEPVTPTAKKSVIVGRAILTTIPSTTAIAVPIRTISMMTVRFRAVTCEDPSQVPVWSFISSAPFSREPIFFFA